MANAREIRKLKISGINKASGSGGSKAGWIRQRREQSRMNRGANCGSEHGHTGSEFYSDM